MGQLFAFLLMIVMMVWLLFWAIVETIAQVILFPFFYVWVRLKEKP